MPKNYNCLCDCFLTVRNTAHVYSQRLLIHRNPTLCSAALYTCTSFSLLAYQRANERIEYNLERMQSSWRHPDSFVVEVFVPIDPVVLYNHWCTWQLVAFVYSVHLGTYARFSKITELSWPELLIFSVHVYLPATAAHQCMWYVCTGKSYCVSECVRCSNVAGSVWLACEDRQSIAMSPSFCVLSSDVFMYFHWSK